LAAAFAGLRAGAGGGGISALLLIEAAAATAAALLPVDCGFCPDPELLNGSRDAIVWIVASVELPEAAPPRLRWVPPMTGAVAGATILGAKVYPGISCAGVVLLSTSVSFFWIISLALCTASASPAKRTML